MNSFLRDVEASQLRERETMILTTKASVLARDNPCRVCGKRLGPHNSTGVCSRPECRATAGVDSRRTRSRRGRLLRERQPEKPTPEQRRYRERRQRLEDALAAANCARDRKAAEKIQREILAMERA